jgi:hypothetical protein
MAEVSGRVQGVRKNEQYGLYSVKIDGTWYGQGKTNPEVEEGDNVTGEYFTNEKGYKTLKGKLKKGAATKATEQAKAPAGAAVSAGTTSSSWQAKDDSIRYQSSRKDALAFLGLPGVLESIVGKAKPADKVGLVESLVDKYTAGYFSDVATFGAVARANGDTTADPSAPPADDEDE